MNYIEHLSKDKKLHKVILTQQPLKLVRKKNVPLRLCASIMSQQLSTKVAEVIFKRFLGLYGAAEPAPQQIADTPIEILRSIGLSNAKANYVQNVARFVMEHNLHDELFNKMGNDEIISLLTQIKGVGKWTVEMLLMFTLGREDVFAIDDYGIQVAMKKIYKLDDTNKRSLRDDMLRISKKWSPFRTYACLHLWKWKDEPAITGIKPAK